MNVDLNIGGLIGAAVGLGLGGLLFYLIHDPSAENNRMPVRPALFVLVIFALAGNFLWGKLFPKSDKV